MGSQRKWPTKLLSWATAMLTLARTPPLNGYDAPVHDTSGIHCEQLECSTTTRSLASDSEIRIHLYFPFYVVDVWGKVIFKHWQLAWPAPDAHDLSNVDCRSSQRWPFCERDKRQIHTVCLWRESAGSTTTAAGNHCEHEVAHNGSGRPHMLYSAMSAGKCQARHFPIGDEFKRGVAGNLHATSTHSLVRA